MIDIGIGDGEKAQDPQRGTIFSTSAKAMDSAPSRARSDVRIVADSSHVRSSAATQRNPFVTFSILPRGSPHSAPWLRPGGLMTDY